MSDTASLLSRALELYRDSEKEYELREFLNESGLYRIHDYETMGDRPVGTVDCGSARLRDTPRALYRALFLFHPERLSFKGMYKETLLTLVSPDYHLVATLEFFKYELAVYFSAAEEHIEGRRARIVCGLPGSDNGVKFKGIVAEGWFGLIRCLLDREWTVYGGNNFVV
jgi:hypothetical protein